MSNLKENKMVKKTIEQITKIRKPTEIPLYRESVQMLKRVEETARLLPDDAAKRTFYQTWADFCYGLAKTDGIREHFKNLGDYFEKEARKYSPQESLRRMG